MHLSRRAFGADPNLLAQIVGGIDANQLLTTAFNRITFDSNITGPVPIELNGPGDPATAALMAQIKPTITLDGPAGHVVIAPQGAATGLLPQIKSAGMEIGIGVGLALLGLLVIGGAVFSAKRSKSMRGYRGYRRRRRA